MADGANYKMIRDLPEPDIGAQIEFDGKNLKASESFKDGKAAQQSGMKYFMKCFDKVIGFTEV